MVSRATATYSVGGRRGLAVFGGSQRVIGINTPVGATTHAYQLSRHLPGLGPHHALQCLAHRPFSKCPATAAGRVEVAASHAVYVSQPAAVAALIEQAATS